MEITTMRRITSEADRAGDREHHPHHRQPPLGWYSRYAPSLHTRTMLLDAAYEYDSDTYDDELPYWAKVGARRQLIVPYSITHNDVRFARQGMTSGDEYLTYIKNAVQCVLEEDPPRMLSFGLHNRIIGHPGRALGLARVLIGWQPAACVITRRIDIAHHWKQVS
jgi:peptidoglycan/xylan/chitin deacetylase (PgdA/CDA1 family)